MTRIYLFPNAIKYGIKLYFITWIVIIIIITTSLVIN